MPAPRMLKQLMAVIDGVTTVVCLDAAGQIREPREPFDTLNGQFQHPPFHIHCRSIIVPYLPGFVVDQRRPANAELARRPRKQRRKGPGGSTASVPPPDRSNPPGRTPPVPPVTPAARRRAAAAAPDVLSDDVAKREVGADVRRSAAMRRMLSDDPGDFRPTSAGGDPVAAEIARQRGADRRPRVVDALRDVAAFVVEWTVGPRRKLKAQRLLRHTSHGEQLRRGRYRAGLGVFGAGIAFWVLLEDDDAPAGLVAAAGAEQLEARLDPDARVIDLDDLHRRQAEALRALDAEPRTAERERWRRVISDEGRFALLLGYDAIRVVHADGTVEIVVVSRTALIVEEP